MTGSSLPNEILHIFPLGDAVVRLDQQNHAQISCSSLLVPGTVVPHLQLSVLANFAFVYCGGVLSHTICGDNISKVFHLMLKKITFCEL